MDLTQKHKLNAKKHTVIENESKKSKGNKYENSDCECLKTAPDVPPL